MPRIPHRTRPIFWNERQRGQSLIEFSLMAIILTILLLGVLDIGRAYFTYMALLDAAGEGAQFGAVNPTYWCASGDVHFDSNGDGAVDGSDSCPADFTNGNPDSIAYRVVNTAPVGTLVDWNTATVAVEMSDDSLPIKPGRSLTVTVSADYQLLTPFIGAIAGTQILKLSASTSAFTLVGDN
jgi:Flp pilus assembly protein TadG